MELETFEQYWETCPKFGNLKEIPVDMARLSMESAYLAGQNSALKWYNTKLQELAN